MLKDNFTNLSDVTVDGSVSTSTQGMLIGSMSEMPIPENRFLGKIVKYTGESTVDFVKYSEYICTEGIRGLFWKELPVPGMSELEGNRVIVTTAGGVIASSDIRDSELASLKGITGSIQAQLDKKLDDNGGTLTTNDFTDELKNKLDGIEPRAQANKIEEIQVNGLKEVPSGTSIDITVPTKVSDLSDSADYATIEFVKKSVGKVYDFKGVQPTKSSLPKTGNKVGDVWDTADTGEDFVWNGTTWESLGGKVDLSAYYDRTEVDKRLADKVPVERNINGKALDSDVMLLASDVDAVALDNIELDIGETSACSAKVPSLRHMQNELAKKASIEITEELAEKQGKLTAVPVVIEASAWENNECVVAVKGMTADCIAFVGPAPESMAEWIARGVYAKNQGQDVLVFQCYELPLDNIVVNVVIA